MTSCNKFDKAEVELASVEDEVRFCPEVGLAWGLLHFSSAHAGGIFAVIIV